MNQFNNGEYKTAITYVVAKYSRIHKKWHVYYEYEEIEDAKERIAEYRKCHPNAICGIFERIKTETINKIAE